MSSEFGIRFPGFRQECNQKQTSPDVRYSVRSTEYKEGKLDSDVYRRIMKGTANINKKYFCPSLMVTLFCLFMFFL